ncbi:hypothetical protein FDP41_000897 [Naegleria fowleri]|uniref:Uncharacterized protein n=1 Tax=Naegleria fowleri TaxID=5763 RepID=A0A6A5BZG9_NAEFO|nr:uncharacterized protein FDP41_000897 [Naegleria fowleri]KAF0979744.1 hypothetical protein FDP41_000897 [Naegleria fowleri]CAG4710587.1 unnamed protein product [Naegleria fowleri]
MSHTTLMLSSSTTTNESPLELLFSKDFFIHVLENEASSSLSSSATSNNNNNQLLTTPSSNPSLTNQHPTPQLHASIRAREIKLLPQNSTTNSQSELLPNTKYLQNNPLITGRYFNNLKNSDEVQHENHHQEPTDSGVPPLPLPPPLRSNSFHGSYSQQPQLHELSTTIVDPSRNDEGLLLPKCFILTHKLNPLSVDEFIESMNTVLRRVRELQIDQDEKLKSHIPYVHLMNGFSIEGILAILDSGLSQQPHALQRSGSSKKNTIFIPFQSYRMQLYEDVFGRVLREGANQARVEEWFANVILSKISEELGSEILSESKVEKNRVADEDNSDEENKNINPIPTTLKFHFFTFIQTYGYWAIPLTDQSSAFDIEKSPLRRLNQILGFRRSKL